MNQMIATTLCPYPPVYLSRRPTLRTPASYQLKAKRNLSFPVKTEFPRLKTKAQFQLSAIQTPPGNGRTLNHYYDVFSCVNHPTGIKQSPFLVRASKRKPGFFRAYPKMEEKPEWWWRSLACLPYLKNIFEQAKWWNYAFGMTNPTPFLQNYGDFIWPLYMVMERLPNWFLQYYTFILYNLIVRRKEWPHFFRFHVMNAMLIGVLVEITGAAQNWFPEWFFPKEFWCVATLLFLVTVLECMRSALVGEYPEIPVVRTGTHLHSDLNRTPPVR